MTLDIINGISIPFIGTMLGSACVFFMRGNDREAAASCRDDAVWEYAMIEAAAQQGWINRQAAIQESVTSIVRAGADVVLTYWAMEVAEWLD